MENIESLRYRLFEMRTKEKELRKQKQSKKPSKAELYIKDRESGMSGIAIAKKYGVTHQAVYKACIEYRKRMERRAEDGK